jgi:hypothetical protein
MRAEVFLLAWCFTVLGTYFGRSKERSNQQKWRCRLSICTAQQATHSAPYACRSIVAIRQPFPHPGRPTAFKVDELVRHGFAITGVRNRRNALRLLRPTGLENIRVSLLGAATQYTASGFLQTYGTIPGRVVTFVGRNKRPALRRMRVDSW